MKVLLCCLLLLFAGVFAFPYTGKTDVVPLTDSIFKETVLEDETAVWVVEFYAPWCGHCRSLAPVWEEVGTEIKQNEEGNIKVGAVNCEGEKKLCMDYGVRGIPSIKAFPVGGSVCKKNNYNLPFPDRALPNGGWVRLLLDEFPRHFQYEGSGTK